MTSLAFFHLVVSCSMTAGEAAQRYGKSVRMIRRWCEEAPISHRLGGGLNLALLLQRNNKHTEAAAKGIVSIPIPASRRKSHICLIIHAIDH